MVSLEQQRIQAIEDEAARQRARDRFLSGGGTEAQLQILQFEKLIKAAGFQLAKLSSKPRTNRTVVRIVAEIKSLEDAIRKLKGLPSKLTESMRDEVQFFSQPTTVFEQIGVQAEPIRTLGAPTQTVFPDQFRLAVSNQSYTAQGTIRIRVSVTLITSFGSGSLDAQLLAKFETSSGVLKKQVRRNISFTSADTVGTAKSVDIITTVSDPELPRITYKVIEVNGLAQTSVAGAIEREVIPNGNGGNGQGTGRQEGFVQLGTCRINFVLTASQLVILGNRHSFVITNPSTEKGTNTIQEILAQIDAGCPTNGGGNGIDITPNIFDKGIVALLAVAALMPRGKK